MRPFLFIVALPLLAHEPVTTKLTWTQEISRLVHRRCAGCHRDGGAAPMPLIAFEQARPWAKAIRDEVLQRRMPPWDAVKGYGSFRDDPSLSLAEIDLIVNWVEGGAPEGDPAYLPSPPEPLRAPRIPEARKVDRVAPPMTVMGVEPAGPMEARVVYRDGSVRDLILIREFRRPRNYWFAAPVRLPAGARVVVDAARPPKWFVSPAR